MFVGVLGCLVFCLLGFFWGWWFFVYGFVWCGFFVCSFYFFSKSSVFLVEVWGFLLVFNLTNYFDIRLEVKHTGIS